MAIDDLGRTNGIQLMQVEGFLEVARRGSVSRAAEALFITEDLVLVCAPDHPFTKRASVAMAEVAGQKLIRFDRTSSYYEITQGAFLSAGVSLRGLMELDSIEAAKKMVERGLGVALLPGTAVAREVSGRTLSAVKMSDAPPMQNAIVAYRRRDAGAPEGTVAAFLDLLETI